MLHVVLTPFLFSTPCVQRRKWTQEEVDALLAGCRIHKPGHWAQILHHAGSVLTGRTQVDLKDKWRNLRKANHPEVLAREAEVAAADAMTAMRHEVSNGGDTELQEEQEEEQEDKGEEARNGAEEAPEQAGNGADEAAEAAMPETEPESRRTRTRKQKRK